MERSGCSTAGRRTGQCRDLEAGISLKCLKKRETSVVGVSGRRLAGRWERGRRYCSIPLGPLGFLLAAGEDTEGSTGESDMFWFLLKKLTQAVELRTDWGCPWLPAMGS